MGHTWDDNLSTNRGKFDENKYRKLNMLRIVTFPVQIFTPH
jgi:hypothetical protein